MMKIKQDNNVINRTGAVYVENKTKLLWLIGLGVIYDKNQIRQWCDWSYKCDIHFHAT